MIICCGEALIDMIPSATADARTGFVPHAGGAVFNTAIALGRLGHETGFVTGLSDDLFGQQLAAALDQSQVDYSHAIRSSLPTTLAFVELSEGQARYTFYDENTAGRSLSPTQLPDLPEAAQALYFGGISLISEPCAEFYAALAEREAQDRLIMIDPNIRASFVQDEARYRARLERMIAVADIVKVSDEDLDWIIGGDTGLDAKAGQLCAAGPHAVIVTRGAEGATAVLKSGAVLDAPAHPAQVVDTVGAGDTFNAGVLARLAQDGFLSKSRFPQIDANTLRNALVLGARVAAVTVSRAGANPPWAHEL
ncbi:carbohydrate kinase family protein [Roseobacter sinensis]|uniref:Carbohydrate kinase n=1 Tax=Roseobacter sinensis TaxID=2931391 RepID=A0ABT3BHV2_9RHOB|nr:carbohydrate kinase [Roseobacter sp. WL0113]MCV3273154.1 carbohydrate kinase [Roseobacter sp. WL0113]